ncbi:DegT/DnrJ/EryC1/StrS family aminotransferase [Holdemanella porci]|uniref:DegT/DnrJ/EryC1/StrS family aminotransferase n=1 Tax=Holdemanella porci TaxID=2652276 RepID=UPI003F8E1943
MEKIQLMNVQRQHEQHAAEYEKAVIDVLRSGLYIGGPNVTVFEEEFAAYAGAKYGISCGNGTDAIVLALRALNIGQGDEVITVSFTFFATAEGIAAVGATPVFVDVDEKTYCMDVSQIEAKITNRTKAIMPVHIYGHSADMDSINAIAKKYNLFVITDCAQSAGTEYNGSRANTLGDVSCFSFFPTKNLGCDGDGGMVVTNNENIARACRSYKVHGSGADGLHTLKEQYAARGEQLPQNMPVGANKYYNYLIGYNSRLDALQAALLRVKLTYLDEFVAGRRKNADLYNEALKDTEYGKPYEAPYTKHSYYIYALQHDNAQTIMERLQKMGVPCGTYYPVPLHLQGAFASLGYKEGDFPVTEKLAKTTFAIPVFPELSEEERNYIVNALKEAIKD